MIGCTPVRVAASTCFVVVFHRLGPYHHARLQGANAIAPVMAVELSRKDNTYLWDVLEGRTPFEHCTLFETQDSESLQPYVVWKAVRAQLDVLRPDVIAIPGIYDKGAVAALRWCRRNRVPCILMSDSTQRDAKRYLWREWLKGRLVRCFSAALVAGKPQEDYVVRLGMSAARVFTGYDAVDNEYFSHQAEAVRAREDQYRAACHLPTRYFVTSNRFIPVKNLFRLLAAYAKYRQRVIDPWNLVLLGDGELMPQVRRSIQELGLQTCVMLPGFKQYDELPVYYALGRCLILASTSETWGLVVNEAMASGLPVLVSKACGCCEDLVREGENGFSFDPLNVEEMAEKMRMISHGGCDLAKMGQASRDIIANWGCDNFARNLWRAAQCACEQPIKNRDPIASAILHILTTVR